MDRPAGHVNVFFDFAGAEPYYYRLVAAAIETMSATVRPISKSCAAASTRSTTGCRIC